MTELKVFKAKTTDEIMDIMREDDAAAEREKILRTMTPQCREKLKFIEAWFRTEMAHTLRSRYELGLQVQELYEDEKKNGGKIYGKQAIDRICKLLNWDDGLIRLTLRFVQTYTKEELEHLCSQVLPSTGEPLTWSHMRTLLTRVLHFWVWKTERAGHSAGVRYDRGNHANDPANARRACSWISLLPASLRS